MRARPLGPIYRWSLRVVVFLGLALSAYLSWAGAAGLPGCDATSPEGCGAVLSTVWGKWLGLPVSMGGAAVFLGLLLATVGMGERPSGTRWFLLAALSITAFASALWFTGLMVFEVHAFCPWCTAVHVCSLVTLALILARAPLGPSPDSSAGSSSPVPLMLGAVAGVAAFSVLIAGQLIGGYEIHIELVKTDGVGVGIESNESMHRHSTSDMEGAGSNLQASAQSPSPSTPPLLRRKTSPDGLPAPRPVSLLKGKLSMTLGEYPILGDPNAEAILGLISDPTCPACRKMHHDLAVAMEHFDHRFAVVVFPMALDAKCNPQMTRTGYGHRNACLFDTMSLALWNIDPAAFRAFDEALFRGMMAPEAEDAMGWAADLLGSDQLTAALNDPLYEKMLTFSIGLFYSPLIDEKLLPVLLGPTEAKLGNPDSVQELYDWIEGQFGWRDEATITDALGPDLKTVSNDTVSSNSLE